MSFNVFTETFAPFCIQPQFGVFSIAEAYGMRGTMIATSLTSADKLITYLYPEKKYFYIWDLEWSRGQQRVFSYYQHIYQNPELQLIARSEPHARAIKNCWGRDVTGIVEDFSIKSFLEIIK